MAFNIDAVDKNAQKVGIWEDMDGSSFRIASISQGSYQKRLTRLRKPYSRAIERETVNPDDLNGIFCKALAEHILVDWKDVIDGNGKEVEYSVTAAISVLQDNDNFRDFVIEVASNQSLYEKQYKEAVVKK